MMESHPCRMAKIGKGTLTQQQHGDDRKRTPKRPPSSRTGESKKASTRMNQQENKTNIPESKQAKILLTNKRSTNQPTTKPTTHQHNNQPNKHHFNPLSHRNLGQLHHRAIRSNHANPRSPSTSTALANHLQLPCSRPLPANRTIPLAGLLPPIFRGAALAIATGGDGGSSCRFSCSRTCQGGLRFGCGSSGGGSLVGLALWTKKLAVWDLCSIRRNNARL